jgi:hypothetical protein
MVKLKTARWLSVGRVRNASKRVASDSVTAGIQIIEYFRLPPLSSLTAWRPKMDPG